MFYVAMLDTMPTADSYSEDDAEVVKAQWLNPFQALNLHYSGRDWLFWLVGWGVMGMLLWLVGGWGGGNHHW